MTSSPRCCRRRCRAGRSHRRAALPRQAPPTGRRRAGATVTGIPIVTFLSDYGLTDNFVGICHGVIARICPDARVIDITHGVPRHDVRAGAVLLAESLPYVPAGVHLAVVDPDVGAQRRAVALECGDGRRLVGPDNGLLWLAADASGGVVQATDIAGSRFRLAPVSATFHGRDIFAPVAAQLAAGTPLGETGDPLDPDELVTLTLPGPRHDGGGLVAHVRYVDRFGNVQLNARHVDLADSGLRLGRPVSMRLADGSVQAAQYVRTFSDAPPGELLVYEDASQRLAVAVAHGDAAQTLGVAVDDELELRPR
jgi:S-adenosyl-L-methionine hydrolase (adenosine-forming)